ncbi:MAG TPA: hypothetical protein VMV59_12155 [Candidatus Dormibacteraeota bacterium]|nr:hypothetical protein [Candidatus Dormibacteraeota bacterium]
MSSGNLTLDETLRGLQTLESQLAEWRAAVANIEAREKEAAQARSKVCELEAQVAVFKSAVTATLAAEAEAKEAEFKAAKRRELGAQIREAIVRRDDLAREVAELNDKLPLVRGAVAGAEERLREHLSSLLTADDFPSDSELAAEKLRGEELRAVYKTALGAQKEVSEQLEKTRWAFLKTDAEVKELSWQEKRLRPPDPPGAHDFKGAAFTVQ